jgi:hypothetical protein
MIHVICPRCVYERLLVHEKAFSSARILLSHFEMAEKCPVGRPRLPRLAPSSHLDCSLSKIGELVQQHGEEVDCQHFHVVRQALLRARDTDKGDIRFSRRRGLATNMVAKLRTFVMAMMLKNRRTLPKAVAHALFLVLPEETAQHFIDNIKLLPSAPTISRSMIPPDPQRLIASTRSSFSPLCSSTLSLPPSPLPHPRIPQTSPGYTSTDLA